MGSSEKFCLRWNDFETNISAAFRELREEKDFFDVTLACDDSQIQAHKVILSACSPFFRNVLRRNPHQHPLLYLKGVKYKDILAVLNFMYMGEVNVAQEELNSFLSVAEDLRVKGLTQNNSSAETPKASKPEPPKQIIKPRDPPERDPIAPPPKRIRPPVPSPQLSVPIQSYRAEDDDVQEVVPVKSEPHDLAHLPMAPVEQPQVYHHNQEQEMVEEHHEQGTVALDDYADESYGYDQYGEGYDDGSGMMDSSGMAMGPADGNKDMENLINSKMTKVPACGISRSQWQCLECPYSSNNNHNVYLHIESKHIQHQGYFCNICNKTCQTKNAFRMHNKRNHEPAKL